MAAREIGAMKRLVNAITCTRFVFALILVLAVLLGQGTAAWLAAAAAALSALEEAVAVRPKTSRFMVSITAVIAGMN